MSKRERLPLLVFILFIFAGFAGIVEVYASVSLYGPGLTHDSAAYMYAAQSLLQGEGFQYFGYPSPFIQWPPLYPLLLAAAGFLGVGAATASAVINALAHGLIIFFAGVWLYSELKNKYLAIVAALGLTVLLPLIQVSRYMWTETLFVLFTLLTFIQLMKYLKSGKMMNLALSGLFSAFACIDRYMGITLVITAALLIFFKKQGLLLKIRDTVIYGAISSAPVLIWVARNISVSGTAAGFRIPSEYSLLQNIFRTAQSVYSWFKPEALLIELVGVWWALVMKWYAIALPLLLVIYLVVRVAAANGKTKARLSYSERFNIIFFIVYIVYLLFSATTVAFEPINSRYLIPVCVPVILLFIEVTDGLAARSSGGFGRKAVGFVCVLAAAAYLVFPALNTYSAIQGFRENGAGGFSTRIWHQNSLVRYVDENTAGRPGSTFYSNNADALYALTGVRTYSFPKRTGPDLYTWGQFEAAVNEDEESIIVWFAGGVPKSLYNIEDIKNVWKLETIIQNESGTVYRILK